jgi:hypothetical protein
VIGDVNQYNTIHTERLTAANDEANLMRDIWENDRLLVDEQFSTIRSRAAHALHWLVDRAA